MQIFFSNLCKQQPKKIASEIALNYKLSPFSASTSFRSTQPQFRGGRHARHNSSSTDSNWQKLFDATIRGFVPSGVAMTIVGGYFFMSNQWKDELKEGTSEIKSDMKILETKLTNDMKGLETKLTNDMKGLTNDMKGLEAKLTNLEVSQTKLATDMQELKTLLLQLVQHDIETRTKFSYIEQHYINDRHHVKNDV